MDNPQWKPQKKDNPITIERSLILRQLSRKLGEIPETLRSQIDALSVVQLERLGEALLDLANLSDLEGWLMERG